MNPKSDAEDALRAFIRREVDRTSAREVSQRAGVSHETVYALLRGAKIAERSRTRLSALTAAPESPAADTASQSVPPGIDAASAWWGRMDETRKHLGRMARIAADLSEMARTAEATVGGLLTSGVIQGASEPAETPAERKARLQREELAVEEQAYQERMARKAREAEAAKAAEEAAQPPARRANGRR